MLKYSFSIMARMPHHRLMAQGGYKSLPNRSAFTNRTGRFRMKGHITPNKKRRGSEANFKRIQKALEHAGVKSAESLPLLKTGQVRKYQRKSRANSARNLHSVPSAATISSQTSLSKKGKRKREDVDDSHLAPSDPTLSKKRSRIRLTLAPRSPSSSSSTSDSVDPIINSASVSFTGQEQRTAQSPFVASSESVKDSSGDTEETPTRLIPLFVSLENEEEAGIQAPPGEHSPRQVLRAIAAGNSLFDNIDIRYFPEGIARQIDQDGIPHDDVVDRNLYRVGLYPNWNPAFGPRGGPSIEHDQLETPEQQLVEEEAEEEDGDSSSDLPEF